MWKFVFSLLLILFSSSIHAQDVIKTLGRYNYPVQLGRAGAGQKAMGFFVRYNQRLFFVTSAQCFISTSQLAANQVDGFNDTLFVLVENDTGKAAFFPLPFIDSKKRLKRLGDVELPDILVVEITNPKKLNVASIEDFFEEDVPCEWAKQVVVAGGSDNGLNDDDDAAKPSFYNASLTAAYCNYPYLADAKMYDQLHYTASFKENCNEQFLAGAPAYLISEDETVVFGGIYAGSTRGGTKTARIVRPEYVMNKIMRKILEK